MTRAEFDVWFTEHYCQLKSWAKSHGAPDPEGAVASAYAVAVTPPVKSKTRTDPLYLHFRADARGDGNPWPRMSTEVRGYAKAQLKAEVNANQTRRALQIEARVEADSYSGRTRPALRAE